MRLAYLNTQYPSLSHTFIEREIRALRARGFTIDTFSIRPPRPQDTLGEHHAAAARDTFCLLASTPRLVLAQLKSLLTSPVRYLAAHVEAQRLSAQGLKPRLLSFTYACEAALLARELRRRGHSHLHVHMANNGAAVALLACVHAPSIRWSLSIHGSAEFFDVHRLNLRAKCESAAFVRCISNFCKAQVMTWSDPKVWPNFSIVPCGVPCGVDSGALTPAPPRPDTPLRLLTVGRLEPIKGYPLLLDALARLKREGVPFSLEMVGSGRMDADLRTRVDALDLADRVTFTGPVGQEDMPRVYDRADAMIVSSFMEGVPVVLMEAMAKELVVIATAVGGVPELVDHGVSGLIVPPGSVEALADAIRSLANDLPRLGSMRRAAREKILRGFTVEHVGDGMADLFRKHLAEPARSSPA